MSSRNCASSSSYAATPARWASARPGSAFDKGLTGASRARPGLDQALAAVREGDTLTFTKLDRLARSVPDALDILGQLSARGVRFALGASAYDWNDPFARMFLQILAVIAEIAALFSVSRPTVYRSLERTTALPRSPAGTRPAPDIARYDRLLTRRPD